MRLISSAVEYAWLPAQPAPQLVQAPYQPVAVRLPLAPVVQPVAVAASEHRTIAAVQHCHAPAAALGRTPPPGALPSKVAGGALDANDVAALGQIPARAQAVMGDAHMVGVHGNGRMVQPLPAGPPPVPAEGATHLKQARPLQRTQVELAHVHRRSTAGAQPTVHATHGAPQKEYCEIIWLNLHLSQPSETKKPAVLGWGLWCRHSAVAFTMACSRHSNPGFARLRSFASPNSPRNDEQHPEAAHRMQVDSGEKVIGLVLLCQ